MENDSENRDTGQPVICPKCKGKKFIEDGKTHLPCTTCDRNGNLNIQQAVETFVVDNILKVDIDTPASVVMQPDLPGIPAGKIKQKKVKKPKGIQPLAPGMVLESNATLMGVTVDALITRLLFQPTTMLIDTKFGQQSVKWLPGNTLGGVAGPDVTNPHKVVIIGKMPWSHETMAERLFVGDVGDLLRETFTRNGLDNFEQWYTTNVLRFMPPRGIKKVGAAVTRECAYLLEQELKAIQPEYILALGTDVVKALFGNSANLSKVRGATDLIYNGAKVIVTNHPSAVLSEPSLQPGFDRDIQTFAKLVKGEDISAKADRHYEQITDVNRLIDIVQEIIRYWTDNPTEPKRLAIDAEWGGTDGSDALRSKFRSIQFSHKPYTGYCIILRRAGLIYDPATCCDEQQAAAVLRILLDIPGVQVGGHNFRSDLLRLKRIDLGCMDQFMRGIDTMLAYHLVYPAEEGFGLEQLSVRLTDLGRYDREVEKWLVDNGYRTPKIGKKKLRQFGYAHVPDDLLFPVYAPADVDVVMRSWPVLERRLQEERLSRPYKTGDGRAVDTLYDMYYTNVHPANIPLEEVESTGINSDVGRLKRLTELFSARRDEMLNQFRIDIKWPDFNQRSSDDIRGFLFGDAYGKGSRPAGGVTLNLQPVKTTEKPSRDWGRVRHQEILDGTVSASTDGESLLILKHQDARAGQLQKVKFVDQIVKNFLRPPNQVEDGDDIEWNEGLIGLLSEDNRIRPTISQLTDTGRYRCYDPNMQNLPKKQEVELRLIFSSDPDKLMTVKKWQSLPEQELKEMGLLNLEYYSIRSCFMASIGHVLIEGDYKQAELNVGAHLAGDPDMLAILSDPKRDMHSEMAILAFKLNCAPEEVKIIYPKQRVLAKNCGFGIFYGRGANALVRQAKTEGVITTQAEMQGIIDDFFRKFPKVKEYIEKCHAAVRDPGYVETLFGRRRYFFVTDSNQKMKAQERESVNAPEILGALNGVNSWNLPVYY